MCGKERRGRWLARTREKRTFWKRSWPRTTITRCRPSSRNWSAAVRWTRHWIDWGTSSIRQTKPPMSRMSPHWSGNTSHRPGKLQPRPWENRDAALPGRFEHDFFRLLPYLEPDQLGPPDRGDLQEQDASASAGGYSHREHPDRPRSLRQSACWCRRATRKSASWTM